MANYTRNFVKSLSVKDKKNLTNFLDKIKNDQNQEWLFAQMLCYGLYNLNIELVMPPEISEDSPSEDGDYPESKKPTGDEVLYRKQLLESLDKESINYLHEFLNNLPGNELLSKIIIDCHHFIKEVKERYTELNRPKSKQELLDEVANNTKIESYAIKDIVKRIVEGEIVYCVPTNETLLAMSDYYDIHSRGRDDEPQIIYWYLLESAVAKRYSNLVKNRNWKTFFKKNPYEDNSFVYLKDKYCSFHSLN